MNWVGNLIQGWEEERKCPTCVRNYGREYLILCDVTEIISNIEFDEKGPLFTKRTNYSFHCGHFKNYVRKVRTR